MSDTPQAIYVREFAWTCEGDAAHSFKNRFRYEPLPCRICDGNCFMQLDYTCPTHNRHFSALVEFSRPTISTESPNTDGVPIVTRYRYVENETWHTSNGTIPCPALGCNSASLRREITWGTPQKPTSRGE